MDRRGKDWNKISRIWTDEKTLREVIYGEKNLIKEWHEGEWDFSSRNSNSPYQSWFCILLRMAREKLEKELVAPSFLIKKSIDFICNGLVILFPRVLFFGPPKKGAFVLIEETSIEGKFP